MGWTEVRKPGHTACDSGPFASCPRPRRARVPASQRDQHYYRVLLAAFTRRAGQQPLLESCCCFCTGNRAQDLALFQAALQEHLSLRTPTGKRSQHGQMAARVGKEGSQQAARRGAQEGLTGKRQTLLSSQVLHAQDFMLPLLSSSGYFNVYLPVRGTEFSVIHYLYLSCFVKLNK